MKIQGADVAVRSHRVWPRTSTLLDKDGENTTSIPKKEGDDFQVAGRTGTCDRKNATMMLWPAPDKATLI